MKNVLMLIGLLIMVSGCSSSVQSNRNIKEQSAVVSFKNSFDARMFKKFSY